MQEQVDSSTRVESVIEVNAAPETVWAIVADLERYGEWNPYITSARGALEEDSELVIEVSAPDRDAFELRPVVTKVTPPWQLKFSFLSSESDLDHVDSEVVIERTPSGCRVSNRQQFGGSLPRGMAPRIGERNQLGVEMMNAALKARAERGALD